MLAGTLVKFIVERRCDTVTQNEQVCKVRIQLLVFVLESKPERVGFQFAVAGEGWGKRCKNLKLGRVIAWSAMSLAGEYSSEVYQELYVV